MKADTAAQAEERGSLVALVASLSQRRKAYLLGRLVATTPVPLLREALRAAAGRAFVGFGQS